MASVVERLELSVRRLGELHVSFAAASDLEWSFSPASLDEADAELDDLRGQLLSMRVTPLANSQRLEEELASLRREMHVQRAGSASAIAYLEKELWRARRGTRGAPASEQQRENGAGIAALTENVPASDSQGGEGAINRSQLPESGAADEPQLEQGESWWKNL
eukprot:scaffold10200_cov122-Isochrysis_galbana.AAC.1